MPGGGHSPEFDYDESKPAGSTKGYDADNWLRSNEMHFDNAYAIEHYSPSNDPDASEDDFGRHDFITVKEQASKPVLTASTNRHAIYAKSDGIYIEDENGTEHLVLEFSNNKIGNDIPSGEIIVFDKDTVVTGYTLKTDVDDKLLFITKGSVAGGQTGGGDHSAGTWTISGLTADAHKHDLPLDNGGGGGLRFNTTPPFGTGANITINRQCTAIVAADTQACMRSDTATATGVTSAGTWRPAARCFTRQERN